MPLRVPAAKFLSLHGATLLAIWLVWLLAGQGAASPRHGIWVACSLLAASLLAPRRALHLLRRLRWLFLAIAITFSLGTPGRLLIDDFTAGPTKVFAPLRMPRCISRRWPPAWRCCSTA